MTPSPSPLGLSRWQMGVLVFCVTLCVTPFAYDSTILLHLHRLAWVALVPAYGVGLLGTGVALALMRRFPGESLPEYAPRVLGTAVGRAYLALLGLVLLTGAPANLYTLTRVVRITELPRTSAYVPALILTAVVAMACYSGPEIFARMGEILAWPVAAGLLVIFLAPLINAVPVRLLPLDGFSWPHYLTPAVSSSLGTVRGFLCLLVLGGTLRGPEGVGRYAFWALSAAALLLALSLAAPVAVLGTGLAERLRYPVIGLTGTVSFRWLPFQRLTTVLLLAWQVLMYVVLAFYLWSGSYMLAAAFGGRSWRPWLLPAAVVSFYLGGATVGPAVSQAAVDAWNFAVLAVGVVAPAGLWLAAVARGGAAVGAP